MWPRTRLSSAATAASASATGSPASAARSSMASSSSATAPGLAARTGTSHRSANALPISAPPADKPTYRTCAGVHKRTSYAMRWRVALPGGRGRSGERGVGQGGGRGAQHGAAHDLGGRMVLDRHPGPAEQRDEAEPGQHQRPVGKGEQGERTRGDRAVDGDLPHRGDAREHRYAGQHEAEVTDQQAGRVQHDQQDQPGRDRRGDERQHDQPGPSRADVPVIPAALADAVGDEQGRSSACCRRNSSISIASVVGSAAAIPLAPDFASSIFFNSSAKRTRSASCASPFLSKPNPRTIFRCSRVEPGASNLKYQVTLPLRLRLWTGISVVTYLCVELKSRRRKAPQRNLAATGGS